MEVRVIVSLVLGLSWTTDWKFSVSAIFRAQGSGKKKFGSEAERKSSGKIGCRSTPQDIPEVSYPGMIGLAPDKHSHIGFTSPLDVPNNTSDVFFSYLRIFKSVFSPCVCCPIGRLMFLMEQTVLFSCGTFSWKFVLFQHKSACMQTKQEHRLLSRMTLQVT